MKPELNKSAIKKRDILLTSAALIIGCVWLMGAGAEKAPAISPGSAKAAKDYYSRISTELSFNATPGVTTLDNLLAFTGYPVSASNLESLDPVIMMDPSQAASANGLSLRLTGLNGATLRDGDILAARFFAPKIVNINSKDPVPGWRKLVRLRVRPDSPAARVGIESVIILFNFFSPANEPPFLGHSFNTQVMVIAPKLDNRLYWLDFDGDGKLTLALNASFDAAALGSTADYFVPDACNACHGSPGNLRPPMVNYLDTDHWFDRLNDDFVSLKNSGTALVFDAHTNDTSLPSYAKAFDVIRRFNEEALSQNAAVHPDSFETQAARTWLRLHAESDQHMAPISRGFSMGNGTMWQASEKDGVERLNRYCFRCHGSIRFSIYDRPAVVERVGGIRARIKPNTEQAKISGWKMPPDRDLDPSELESLDKFLKDLK